MIIPIVLVILVALLNVWAMHAIRGLEERAEYNERRIRGLSCKLWREQQHPLYDEYEPTDMTLPRSVVAIYPKHQRFTKE